MFEKYIHLEIEQSLLSILIRKPNEIWNCWNLNADCFIEERHKKIFEAILFLRKRAIPLTIKSLGDLLPDDEDKKYIVDLYADIRTENARELSRYLAEETEKYTMLCNLQVLLNEADADNKISLFEQLDKIIARKIDVSTGITIDEMKAELEKKMRGEDTSISISIPLLDEYINKLQKGRLYVVGARPAMGKTAFMCSIIEKIEREHIVGIISLEMTTGEIKQRIACLRGGIRNDLIEKGKCTQKEAEYYFNCLDDIDSNIVVNDKSGLDRYQISSIIRNMVIREHCEAIFLDHLGLIKTETKSNLAHEIGENTTMLKGLAKEFKIPIVCLCQINRGAEQFLDKKPKLSDLRDSGRIEEDADCVILLYRDSYYNPDCSNEAEYCVAKCRNGRTGIVKGRFEGEYMRWS